MLYPIVVSFEEDQVREVYLKDIPSIKFTCYPSADEKARTGEVLMLQMQAYIAKARKARQLIPMPTYQEDVECLHVPIIMAMRIHIFNIMTERKMSRTELARMLDVVPQAVTRILDPQHEVKASTLERVLTVLGYVSSVVIESLPNQR